MLSTRQLLLMGRARDRAIDIAIAPLGTVILLPDPDFRRRVGRCVRHVGLAFVAQWVRRMDRAVILACPIMVVGVGHVCGTAQPGIRRRLPPPGLVSAQAPWPRGDWDVAP